MGIINDIEPRRLALRYEPPSIVVEYTYNSGATKELYHRAIDLKAEVSLIGANRSSELHINKIVSNILKQHADIVGNCKVRSAQLDRLVRKLIDHRMPAHETPSITGSVLPHADYNCVSEMQLKLVKQKMDIVFQQNIVLPDQDGYQYDRQIEFQTATESSDWDE